MRRRRARAVAAESFVHTAGRVTFGHRAEHVALDGEGAGIPKMDLPRATSQRQAPRADRARLAAIAAGRAAAAA